MHGCVGTAENYTVWQLCHSNQGKGHCHWTCCQLRYLHSELFSLLHLHTQLVWIALAKNIIKLNTCWVSRLIVQLHLPKHDFRGRNQWKWSEGTVFTSPSYDHMKIWTGKIENLPASCAGAWPNRKLWGCTIQTGAGQEKLEKSQNFKPNFRGWNNHAIFLLWVKTHGTVCIFAKRLNFWTFQH